MAAWRGRNRKLWDSSTRLCEFTETNGEPEPDLIDLVRQEILEANEQSRDEETSTYIDATVKAVKSCMELEDEPQTQASRSPEEVICRNGANECLMLFEQLMTLF